MAGSCEFGNEPSGSIKYGCALLGWLTSCNLEETCSAKPALRLLLCMCVRACAYGDRMNTRIILVMHTEKQELQLVTDNTQMSLAGVGRWIERTENRNDRFYWCFWY